MAASLDGRRADAMVPKLAELKVACLEPWRAVLKAVARVVHLVGRMVVLWAVWRDSHWAGSLAAARVAKKAWSLAESSVGLSVKKTESERIIFIYIYI